METDEIVVENGDVTPLSEDVSKDVNGIASSCEEDTTPPETESAPAAPTASFLQTEYAALAAEMPEGLPFASLAAFPALGPFLLLREHGVSPREAYLSLTESAKQQTPAETAHLRAAAPRTVAPAAPTVLSRETLAEWRRLFPHLSDREIATLYRRTAPQPYS